MKVLVTGAGGMAGAELVRQARAKGWEVVAFTRADLDVTDASAVEGAIGRERPEVIFNAAAYTAVDAAENSPEQAMAVNAAGAGNISRAARINGAAVIHISTDYVFDGTACEPYRPDDRPAPINVYGESKLAGEIAVKDECPNHVIVRTSWVYSHEGKNFVKTMLRVADERREIRVVNDQHGCPTSSADLAAALIRVAEFMMEARVVGTFHFCNANPTTWYEFADAIFEAKGGDRPTLIPISTEEFPTPAERPRWSVLDTSSFEKTFGMMPRPWRAALQDTMEKLS
ncbi:MAG TPA: dTDP-4-dehydrorhamnose reductase [Gemmatimonadaceae bacterium]